MASGFWPAPQAHFFQAPDTHPEFSAQNFTNEQHNPDSSAVQPSLLQTTSILNQSMAWLDGTDWVERYFWYGAMYDMVSGQSNRVVLVAAMVPASSASRPTQSPIFYQLSSGPSSHTANPQHGRLALRCGRQRQPDRPPQRPGDDVHHRQDDRPQVQRHRTRSRVYRVCRACARALSPGVCDLSGVAIARRGEQKCNA